MKHVDQWSDDASTARLLERAEGVCAGESSLPAGHANRLAAWLTRHALERQVEALLREHGVTSVSTQMRARLACLLGLGDPHADAADRAWVELSAMCHQHAYELNPTAEEVLGLILRVRQLSRAV